MSLLITDDCMACGLCVRACPNEAISDGDLISAIDPERCTECVGAAPSPLCRQECPSDAIAPDPSRNETREDLIAKWTSLHPGETPRLFPPA